LAQLRFRLGLKLQAQKESYNYKKQAYL
jgi:hypothetical protein